MVFYFRCANHPEFKVYMGKDKFENEHLIRWGHPEDVWFHVENLSSAHVYIRLPADMTWESIPEAVLKEMCQLVKSNSLEGCKKESVGMLSTFQTICCICNIPDIIYTPWSNLKKNGNMDIGQVGFKDDKLVKYFKRVSKDKEVLKRLEKTRIEAFPDLEKERKDRDLEEIHKRRKLQKELQIQERELMKERMAERAMKSYASLHKKSELNEPDTLQGDGTVESCREIEEDFM